MKMFVRWMDVHDDDINNDAHEIMSDDFVTSM